MSSYERNNISLKTAMTIDIRQSIRIWTLPGLHLKIENFPENATFQKTLVMLTPSGNWNVGLEWTVESDTGYHFTIIAQYSSLQELLDNLPKFAELKGDLFALC